MAAWMEAAGYSATETAKRKRWPIIRVKKKEHEPGGKVELKMPTDTIGAAYFSKCKKYRWLLVRQWDLSKPTKAILWILMNPSTATADVNDPTIAKVCKFSRRWGYNRVLIVNMMGYRATNPKDLLDLKNACGYENQIWIANLAVKGTPVICAWGKTHKRLMRHENSLRKMLRKTVGVKYYAMRLNNDGGPYHPLYLPDNTKPILFDP
jgi:hypothetical protein